MWINHQSCLVPRFVYSHCSLSGKKIRAHLRVGMWNKLQELNKKMQVQGIVTLDSNETLFQIIYFARHLVFFSWHSICSLGTSGLRGYVRGSLGLCCALWNQLWWTSNSGRVKAAPQSSSSITNVKVYLAAVPFSSLTAKTDGMKTSARSPFQWGSVAGGLTW